MMVRMGLYGDKLPGAVAEQLRAERAAKRWTYKELAVAAGLTEQSVMRYLTGKRDIGLPELAKLADGLGLSPSEVIARAVDRIK